MSAYTFFVKHYSEAHKVCLLSYSFLILTAKEEKVGRELMSKAGAEWKTLDKDEKLVQRSLIVSFPSYSSRSRSWRRKTGLLTCGFSLILLPKYLIFATPLFRICFLSLLVLLIASIPMHLLNTIALRERLLVLSPRQAKRIQCGSFLSYLPSFIFCFASFPFSSAIADSTSRKRKEEKLKRFYLHPLSFILILQKKKKKKHRKRSRSEGKDKEKRAHKKHKK